MVQIIVSTFLGVEDIEIPFLSSAHRGFEVPSLFSVLCSSAFNIPINILLYAHTKYSYEIKSLEIKFGPRIDTAFHIIKISIEFC